jgi:hypothetical protein
MTNREKLLHTNIYDLLCRMQENVKNEPFDRGLLPCVLFYVTGDANIYHCVDYYDCGKIDCNRCIEEWMNERCE